MDAAALSAVADVGYTVYVQGVVYAATVDGITVQAEIMDAYELKRAA